MPALINQGFKQVNAVDYFLNKFGEVLKHVIPESIVSVTSDTNLVALL